MHSDVGVQFLAPGRFQLPTQFGNRRHERTGGGGAGAADRGGVRLMWGREDLQKLVAHVMVTAWLRRREGLETELRSSDPLPFGGRHASTGYIRANGSTGVVAVP